MTLQETIVHDLELAIASRHNEIRDVLKVISAEISRKPTKIVADDEVLKIIKKLKEDAIQCGTLTEVPILEKYLPAMMSEQGIKDYVWLIINTEHLTEIKDMGRVMAHIRTGGLAQSIDNNLASKYAKEFLSQ
jgi:uncharacterized protein YqeY